MEYFLFALLGATIDPIRLLPSILVGAFAARWLHVGIGVAAVATLLALVGNALGGGPNVLVGVLATAIPAAVTFALKSGLRKPKRNGGDAVDRSTEN